MLPLNIETIIFDNESNFNQNIENLSHNLKKIIFGYKFNKSLNFLPHGIEEIKFTSTSDFNQELNDLPQSLKKITLGSNFTHLLHCLPNKLEYLKISSLYSHKLTKLPEKLKYLYFEDIQNNIFPEIFFEPYEFNIFLPNNLIEINFPDNYHKPINKIPNSLEILYINTNYKHLNELKKEHQNIKIITFSCT